MGIIYLGAPAISGDVCRDVYRLDGDHTALSAGQVQALSRWLDQHKSGWGPVLTPPGGKGIKFQVNLRHSDGAVTSVDFVAKALGAYSLVLTGPGKWAYRSRGGLLKSYAADRSISDQELAALQKMAGVALTPYP